MQVDAYSMSSILFALALYPRPGFHIRNGKYIREYHQKVGTAWTVCWCCQCTNPRRDWSTVAFLPVLERSRIRHHPDCRTSLIIKNCYYNMNLRNIVWVVSTPLPGIFDAYYCGNLNTMGKVQWDMLMCFAGGGAQLYVFHDWHYTL